MSLSARGPSEPETVRSQACLKCDRGRCPEVIYIHHSENEYMWRGTITPPPPPPLMVPIIVLSMRQLNSSRARVASWWSRGGGGKDTWYGDVTVSQGYRLGTETVTILFYTKLVSNFRETIDGIESALVDILWKCYGKSQTWNLNGLVLWFWHCAVVMYTVI